MKKELESKFNELRNILETQRKKLGNLVTQNNKISKIDKTGKKKKYYNLDNLIFIFTNLILPHFFDISFHLIYNQLN